MKIMASGPITSWEIDGETVETVSDFIFWASKSLQMVTAAMKLKVRTLPEISASAAEVLEERILVARATGTCVTPKECQRYNK